MTATPSLAPTPGGAPAAGPVKARRWGCPVILLLIAAGLVAFSAVRVITGADDLTSAGAVGPRWPPRSRSAWPAWAGCGRSGPAWSTSASRA